MADNKKPTLKGASAHNVILKGGGFATIQRGDPIPDDISPESLKRLTDSGVLDNELPGPDWEALAKIGTGPAPDEQARQIGAATVDPLADLGVVATPPPTPAAPAPVPGPPAS